MQKKIVILLCMLYCGTIVYCSNIDSMHIALNTAKQDSDRINTLLAIAQTFVRVENDSALYYLDKCNSLIEKSKNYRVQYDCYFEYIKVYHDNAEYDTALAYCLKSIKIAKKNNNKFQEANSYRTLFNLYHNLGDNEQAVKYGIYALNLSISIGDTLNLPITYGNLCWLYYDLRQYKKAIMYGEKGIEDGKKYHDIVGLLVSINNTALAYRSINNDKKAEQLYKLQLEIATKENKPRSKQKALTNLCYIYFDANDKINLNKYTNEYNTYIVNNKINLNSKDKSYGCLINAYNYFLQRDFQKTESKIIEGLEIAESDSLSAPLLDLYQLYSNLKFAKQDFTKGYYYLAKWDSVDQAQFEEELSDYSLQLETKYKTAQKENEILKQQQQLKKRSTLISILIGFILLSFLFSFLIYHFLKQRNTLLENQKTIQAQKIIDLEKEKLLDATEAVLIAQEDERSRIAKDLHDGLGGLLSGVKYSLNNMKENVILSSENAISFERTIDMLDSGIQELRRVAHNMMPENLVKFGLDIALKDYCNSISKTNVILINYSSFGMDNYQSDINTSVTVYRIIQELINNTIKHANATESIVQLAHEHNMLHITVEDNGKGFDTKNINNFKGAGWSNIMNRITYLKGKIDIESNEKNGTSIVIEISLV